MTQKNNYLGNLNTLFVYELYEAVSEGELKHWDLHNYVVNYRLTDNHQRTVNRDYSSVTVTFRYKFNGAIVLCSVRLALCSVAKLVILRLKWEITE